MIPFPAGLKAWIAGGVTDIRRRQWFLEPVAQPMATMNTPALQVQKVAAVHHWAFAAASGKKDLRRHADKLFAKIGKITGAGRIAVQTFPVKHL